MIEPTPQELAAKHCLLQDFPGIVIESMTMAPYIFAEKWGVVVKATLQGRNVEIYCKVFKENGYLKVLIVP